MIKDYMKSLKTRIKRLFYDSDRGVKELADNAPFGHSGKINYTIVWAAGAAPVAPLVIPAGFRAFITMVEWNLTVMTAAPAAFVLRDNAATAQYVSAYVADGVADPFLWQHKVGNGKGVIGRATGTLTVVEILAGAPNYGTGSCKLTYYLRPQV